MIEQLDQIQKEALGSLETVESEASLQDWKVTYLGRSSALMQVFDRLGALPKEERPVIGRRANEVKRALEEALTRKGDLLSELAVQRALETERVDVTLPGRTLVVGRLHPVTQTLRQIYRIFAEMGFQIYRSREVETDEYNFELLNMPAHHPARDMWDTFFTTLPGVVLRTHTSPGQIHVMREYAPEPIRVILPGMCYRYEQVSARYEMQFTQVEGLAVGPGITFGDLKGTLTDFARRMFGQEVRIPLPRLALPFHRAERRDGYRVLLVRRSGCAVCKNTGWLEILGCGMVHPTVLRNGGYDPERYTGFAFGMGAERISMLRHRIDDIRYF